MAKQLVGPVERHVEKIVAGVAGLCLIGVLALYLVSSPNKVVIDQGSPPVAPSGIDSLLAQKSNQVAQQIRTARGAVEAPEPVADKFASLLDPFKGEKLGAPLARGAQLNPAVPIIDPPSVIEGSAKLVEVYALPKPEVYSGRSTVVAGNDVGATNWVTVASKFEVKKQIEAQGLAYGETRKKLIYASVDLQRRSQRPDGSWSDDDWEDVVPFPAFELPNVPELTLEGEGKKVSVPKEGLDALQRMHDFIADPGRQQMILRPLFVEVLNGDRWALPKQSTLQQLMIFDDEIRSPEFVSETLEDRYGLTSGQVVAPTESLGGNEIKAALQEGQRRLAKANTDQECIEIYNIGSAILTNPAASKEDKDKALKLQKDAEQRQNDLRRRGGGSGPSGPVQPKRTPSAQQVVWAHDAGLESLPSGRTMQYRIRMTLLNLLAGEPLLLRNKEDATQVFVHGPWSEPSDAIEIPATERYFITACDERRQEINVEMFRWFDGVWVKNRSKFGIGQPLSVTLRTPVPGLDDPTKADNALVDFAANAAVLDIDFKRSIRESKKGSGKGGVKFAATVTDCAVVLMDKDGQLVERLVAIDKNHPDKDYYNSIVWKPSR